MKKTWGILLFILGAVGIVLAIRAGLPKYSYMLPGFGLLLLLDLYLWFPVYRFIRTRSFSLKLLIWILYWLPLSMLLVSVIAGFFRPFETWNVPFRTYITGIAGVAYISKIFPIIGYLVSDVIRVFHFIFLKLAGTRDAGWKSIPRWKIFTITGWATGTLFFLLLLWGMIFGIYDFRVKRVELPLADLPPSFNGITIAQLSDIHLGSWPERSKLSEAIAMTNSLHPDIIFFTGDMANFYTGDVLGWEGILKDLKAPGGIFTILGNHDYGDYLRWSDTAAKQADLKELFDFYDRLGWKLLRNEHVIIKRGNDSIAIVGVENWGSYKRFQRRADLLKAEKGVEGVPVQLLLSHDPSYWDHFIYGKHPDIDVTFSGHTHGFQFGIETGSILWSPLERMYNEWAGLYSKPVTGHRTQYIYVNRGLGTIGFPGRVGILPEITLFTLKRAK